MRHLTIWTNESTQNAIQAQTTALQQTICNENRATRDLITQNTITELNNRLNMCRDENSNLRQTAAIGQQIDQALRTGLLHLDPQHGRRQCCYDPCCPPFPPWWHPHPWPNGNGNGNGNGGPPGPP